MFCDDKYSQANAKRIKNQWNKLSWSDKVSVENIHYIYLTSTNFRTEHFFEPICWDGDQVSSFGNIDWYRLAYYQPAQVWNVFS